VLEKKKILWITPGGTNDFDLPIWKYLEAHVSPKFAIETVSMERGPHHLEHQYYCALAIPDILHRIKLAEKEGYAAAIIGGFYDLGLWEAREITEKMVVVAPGESCMHIATTLGRSFSIIVGRKLWIPKIAENVSKYGFTEKLASFKTIHMGVLEFQASKKETLKRLLASAREAVEKDLAEVIILGCTIEFGFFRDLQEQLSIPVIDPVLATYKYAEFLVDLQDHFGWSHSKALSYQTPSSEEITKWALAKQYSFDKTLWS
jgi:allantoin racemase